MQTRINSDQSVPCRTWLGDGDRIGVVASIVCAAHCAVTPLLFLLLPAFGRIWSHSASHWLMALLVVPLAAMTVVTRYKAHRSKWVPAAAGIGIFLVLVGAAAPRFEKPFGAQNGAVSHARVSDTIPENALNGKTGATLVTEWEQQMFFSNFANPYLRMPALQPFATQVSGFASADSSATVPSTSVGGYADSCCPSIQTLADGGWRIHIPLASFLTMLGGLFLIAAHLGNLCRCKVEQAAI